MQPRSFFSTWLPLQGGWVNEWLRGKRYSRKIRCSAHPSRYIVNLAWANPLITFQTTLNHHHLRRTHVEACLLHCFTAWWIHGNPYTSAPKMQVRRTVDLSHLAQGGQGPTSIANPVEHFGTASTIRDLHTLSSPGFTLIASCALNKNTSCKLVVRDQGTS